MDSRGNLLFWGVDVALCLPWRDLATMTFLKQTTVSFRADDGFILSRRPHRRRAGRSACTTYLVPRSSFLFVFSEMFFQSFHGWHIRNFSQTPCFCFRGVETLSMFKENASNYGATEGADSRNCSTFPTAEALSLLVAAVWREENQ